MTDLYKIFSEADIRKGRKLLSNRNVSAEINGNYVMGRVYDLGLYNVVIELKNHQIKSMVCNCRKARDGNCEHEAAFIMYLQEKRIIKSDEEHYDDIDQLFDQYINRSHTINDKDYRAFQTAILKKMNQIQNEIDKDLAVKKFLYICKILQSLFNTKESIKPMIISLLYLCITYLVLYNNKDIENKIFRLIEKNEDEGNEELCIAYVRYFIYSYKDFDMNNIFESIVKAFQITEHDIIKKYMVINLYLEMNNRNTSIATKINMMKQCGNSSQAYRFLFEYYKENNDIENEKETLINLLSMDDIALGTWLDYRDIMLDLIKQTKDKDRYLKFLTIMFSRNSYIDDDRFIKILKNYYKKKEWEKEKKTVFETIKKDCPVENYCDALYKANEYKELFCTIIEKKDINLFNQYESVLKNFSEETAAMFYVYIIEVSLKDIRDKYDYRYILNKLCYVNDFSYKDDLLFELCLYLTSNYPKNKIMQSFVRDLKEELVKDRKETTAYEYDNLPF